MDLSIIIVNWNSVKFLGECLRTVFAETRGIQFEVIVIDSGSFDGSAEMLPRDFPQVRFIQSQENLGFAKANNLAAKGASGEFLLLLNPDTEVRRGALTRLVEEARRQAAPGAFGARLINTDGTLQTSCIQAFPTVLNQFLDSNWLRGIFPRSALWGTAPLYASSSEPVLVQGISGACLLTSRELFQQLGGLSEQYFMYFEDTDYCLRCAKAGRKNYYVPTAEVVHHGGKSSGGGYSKFSSVMMAESAWRFFRKEHGPLSAALFRFSVVLKATLRSLLLAVALPFACVLGRSRRVSGAFFKWAFVLRWAFGAESWAAHR